MACVCLGWFGVWCLEFGAWVWACGAGCLVGDLVGCEEEEEEEGVWG